jgi:hypothetical protein
LQPAAKRMGFRGMPSMGKTNCPITRAEFREHAKPVEVNIGGSVLTAPVKEFSTGSLGWYLNAKTMIDVNGKKVTVQIGLNLTIVGSKELERDNPPPVSEP